MQEKIDIIQIVLLAICFLAVAFIMCFYTIFIDYKLKENKEFVKWYFSFFGGAILTLGLLEVLQILLK